MRAALSRSSSPWISASFFLRRSSIFSRSSMLTTPRLPYVRHDMGCEANLQGEDHMSNEMESLPLYQSTMDALERAKRTTAHGGEYWLAREICPILGYTDWGNFEGVIQKASDALKANG